ncbi:MAG: Na(+)/H(+) antiporter subunit B [Burkholderiaceae bacterium]|nr:Na(+)/H(+) antiporter subunit B [Burkholderiaceae bacterium]MEB2319145.1 Na(+)/H(+) antiporter subunit B [Pseudomonadota bacterium]
MNNLILQLAGRVVLPISLVFSLYLLWRGHNEPGGGFVGGLIAAAGFAVYGLPRGRSRLLAALRWPPAGIAGAGLLMALLSGIPGLLSGSPYLTHQWKFWDGGFAVGTALAFDVGVYLAVLGSVCAFVSFYLGENET